MTLEEKVQAEVKLYLLESFPLFEGLWSLFPTKLIIGNSDLLVCLANLKVTSSSRRPLTYCFAAESISNSDDGAVEA